MNKVIITGNVTRINTKHLPEADITNMTVAVDRPHKGGKTDFINVVVFGAQANTCEQYITVGKLVGVEGSWQNNNYQKDGETVYRDELRAERVEFLGSNRTE